MGNPTRLGALLAVFLFASDSMAQSPEARINAPGGNPANLARPFVHHAGEEGRVLFRTRTILIQVPVVVTERNGTHVHGLPKDQFEVFENGKQQNIVTFEEVVATNTPILLAAPPPGVFSNLPISADQPRSVTVVAIDLVNTPFLSQANARQQLIKYLGDNLDSSQATALVLFDERGVRVLQGLTTDAGSLVKLIKELNGQLPALHGVSPDSREDISGSSLLQPSGPTITSNSLRAFIDGGSNYAVMEQQDAVLATMRAFMIVAETLAGIPGQKSLIWATGSFPFYMNSPDTSPLNYPLLSQSYEHAIAALSQAQIAVYPVDVRGLVYFGPTAQSPTNHMSSWPGPGYNAYLASRGQSLQTSIETMQNFAETTGGRSFYNSNDLAGEFKRAADDASSYYLLGYYFDTHNDKSGWRKLKVKVLQRDTQVRAREGFLMTSTTMNPDATRDTDLKFALNSPFDATSIFLTVRWQPGPVPPSEKDGDKKTVVFTLQVSGRDLTTVGSQNEIDVDILTVARNGAVIADNIGNHLKGEIPPEKFAKLKSEGLDYTGRLHLVRGSYLVRFVVRDNQSGRMGSLTAPLTVP